MSSAAATPGTFLRPVLHVLPSGRSAKWTDAQIKQPTTGKGPTAGGRIDTSDARSYPFPVWSGLLTRKHWARIGNALWVFLWLLDRTTLERDGWGIVLGGKPVRDEEIATCFGFHRNKTANHRRRLLRSRYIEATRTPYGFVYRVRNSRKFGIWGKKRSTESGGSVTERSTGSGDSQGERSTETGDSRCNETGGNKEDHVVRPCSNTKPISCANPSGPHEAGRPLPNPSNLDQSVRRVWAYYLEKLGKNHKLLTLTHLRLKKGMARLRECVAKAGGDLGKAEELLKAAVDALAASDFHRGDNDRKMHYDSWEKHLFPSQEKLEWWLEQ